MSPWEKLISCPAFFSVVKCQYYSSLPFGYITVKPVKPWTLAANISEIYVYCVMTNHCEDRDVQTRYKTTNWLTFLLEV